MYSLYLRHILIQNKLNDGRTSQKCKLGKRLKSSFLYLVQPGREEIEKIISLFSSGWKAVARGREWWAASSKCVMCVFSWNPDQSCCWAAGPSRGQSEVDNVTEQSVESGLARQHTTSLTTLPPEGGQGSPATRMSFGVIVMWWPQHGYWCVSNKFRVLYLSLVSGWRSDVFTIVACEVCAHGHHELETRENYHEFVSIKCRSNICW